MSPQRSESDATKDTAPQATELVDHVQYAPGSVVSRTIVDKKTGTVTLFAFDKGQGLSEHSAPFDALVLILDGQAELVIGGSPVRARTGQMVIMPAHIPHAVRAVDKFKMLLIMIR